MVNLLITLDCNRDCVYCFAKEKREAYSHLREHTYMSMGNLEKALDFVRNGGGYAVQLAGGEPTIHPEFDEILDKILQRGFYVNILSNCLWREEKNEYFESISPTRMGFLLNIDHPETYNCNEWETIEYNLERIGDRLNTTLSFNIFEENPRGEYIFELAEAYNVKNIRLSFSMPVVFGNRRNIFIPIEKYEILTPYFMRFTKKAKEMGLQVKMDNTVPLCMFTKEQMADLLLDEVIDLKRNFICFPVIDIGPDLSVWRCFGTSGLYNKKLSDFRDLNDLYSYYEAVFKHLQYEVFPMDKCYECEFAGSKCQGGCIGYSIARCIDEEVSLDTIYDDLLSQRYRLDEDVVFTSYTQPESTVLVEKGADAIEIPEKMLRLITSFREETTLAETIKVQMGIVGDRQSMMDPLDELLYVAAIDEALPFIRTLLTRKILVFD